MQCRMAFCQPSTFQIKRRNLSSNVCGERVARTVVRTSRVLPRRVKVLGAAHPPRKVGNVAKDLREALQKSLKARTSRIEVRLPFGAKLGTEKRGKEESVMSQRTAGDRELGRLISGMFEGTGLSVCVAFASDGERNAARKLWGPLATCSIVSWASGGSGKGKKKSIRAKTGFGQPQNQTATVGTNESNDTGDFDVLVAVGGGAGFMDKVRKCADSVGMDKLIIVANPNSQDDTPPVDLQRYFEDEFESVYYYLPNPSPKWSGGVLFRKFPDEWVFCRLTGVGLLQELIKSNSKPSMDDIEEVLQREGSSAGNQFMKSFNDLFGN